MATNQGGDDSFFAPPRQVLPTGEKVRQKSLAAKKQQRRRRISSAPLAIFTAEPTRS
jgi:hypothetical protein